MEKIRFKDYLLDYLDENNISNVDFSNRLGISRNQLQLILSGKSSITKDLMEKISLVTDIPMEFIFKIEQNYNFELEIDNFLNENNITKKEYINQFKYKELIKNNWCDFIDETDDMEIAKDILKYLRVTKPTAVYEINTNMYYKSKNDKFELLVLWLEKCYRECLKQEIAEYNKENIKIIVNGIYNMAFNNEFNIPSLQKLFNDNGIYLVIQEDIKGSKIRGAFKVHRDKPAIYLTLKHKRLADIYFALLHELAHCKSDFNKARSTSLISYDDSNVSDITADQQAYEWMISNNDYENIKITFINLVNEVSILDKYPKSFIAYRLAADKIIEYSSEFYQSNNPVINFENN